jgi:hypothetical protein
VGCLLAVLAAALHPAAAAQRLAVRVTRHDAQFTIAMRVALPSAPWAVFAALEDYSALPHYNPDIRSVHIEPTDRPARLRVVTTFHACVLFLCRTLRQTALMTATAAAEGGVIRAAIVPEQGDFRSGQARWQVSPCRSGRDATCLQVHMILRPAFWVPPLLGPWILQRKLAEEARRTVNGIKQLAASLRARCAAVPARRQASPDCPRFPLTIDRRAPTARPRRAHVVRGIRSFLLL